MARVKISVPLWLVAAICCSTAVLLGCGEKAPPPQYPDAPPPVLAQPIGGPTVYERFGYASDDSTDTKSGSIGETSTAPQQGVDSTTPTTKPKSAAPRPRAKR